MISILGIGTSRPQTILDRENGIYTTLKNDYINSTSNKDVREAIKNTDLSTTELGCQAALAALQDANIEKEQIGLIIADCSTPVETIPGESQRIACMLGVRIPAFDIISGTSALFNILSSIDSWKDERVPDYVLIVTVSSPTQRVDFSKTGPQRFFSDSASAAVISKKHKGLYAVKEFRELSNDVKKGNKGALQLNLFGHLDINEEIAKENYLLCTDKLRNSKNISDYKVFADRYLNYPKETDFLYPDQGASLGAGLLSSLKENAGSIKTLNRAAIFNVNLETSGGNLILLEVLK